MSGIFFEDSNGVAVLSRRWGLSGDFVVSYDDQGMPVLSVSAAPGSDHDIDEHGDTNFGGMAEGHFIARNGSSQWVNRVLDAGDISTGTVAIARGGTNLGSYTKGDLLYASATDVLAALAGASTDGWVLTWDTGTDLPEWRVLPSAGAVIASDVGGTDDGERTFGVDGKYTFQNALDIDGLLQVTGIAASIQLEPTTVSAALHISRPSTSVLSIFSIETTASRNFWGGLVNSDTTNAYLGTGVTSSAAAASMGFVLASQDVEFYGTTVTLANDTDIIAAGVDGALTISGGSSSVLGGRMVLHSETKSADPDDILFYASGSEVLHWDESSNRWETDYGLLANHLWLGPGGLMVTSTVVSPQLSVRYDASNIGAMGVSSTGVVTFSSTGSGASFILDDPVRINAPDGESLLEAYSDGSLTHDWYTGVTGNAHFSMYDSGGTRRIYLSTFSAPSEFLDVEVTGNLNATGAVTAVGGLISGSATTGGDRYIVCNAYTGSASLYLDSGNDETPDESYIYFQDDNATVWYMGKNAGDGWVLHDSFSGNDVIEIYDNGYMWIRPGADKLYVEGTLDVTSTLTLDTGGVGYINSADGDLILQRAGSTRATFANTLITFPVAVTCVGALGGATITATTKFLAPNGSASAPTYAFADETGMGFYRIAAKRQGFVADSKLAYECAVEDGVPGVSDGVDVRSLRMYGAANSPTYPNIFHDYNRDCGLLLPNSTYPVVALCFDGVQSVAVKTTGIYFGDGGTTDYMLVSGAGLITYVGDAGVRFGEISVEDNTTATTISSSSTWYQVTVFDTNTVSHGVTADYTSGHLTILADGWYEITMTCSVFSGSGLGAVYECEVMLNNGATRALNVHWDRQMAGGGGDVGVASGHGYIDLSVGDTVEVWVQNKSGTANITFEDITLTAEQKAGT